MSTNQPRIPNPAAALVQLIIDADRNNNRGRARSIRASIRRLINRFFPDPLTPEIEIKFMARYRALLEEEALSGGDSGMASGTGGGGHGDPTMHKAVVSARVEELHTACRVLHEEFSGELARRVKEQQARQVAEVVVEMVELGPVDGEMGRKPWERLARSRKQENSKS